MALNDEQKKKGGGLLVDGTPGLQLVPGSGAAQMADAIGSFKQNYNDRLAAGAKVNLANNLRIINPADPESMKVTPPNRGLPVRPPVTAPVAAAPAAPGASSTQAAKAPNDAARAPAAAAQPPASPASQPTDVGASTLAGGGSAFTTGSGRQGVLPAGVSVVRQPNGVNSFSATGASVAGAVPAQVPGAQAVPNPAPIVMQPTVATGPGVASTFGQSVITMPDDNQMTVRKPTGAFTGPGEMAEQYNSREDREAQKKLLSDLDSQIFALSLPAGRGERDAIDAISRLRQTQAQIIGGASGITADAKANRAANAAALTTAGMEIDGQAARQGAQIQADTAIEGMRQQGDDRRAAGVQRPMETMQTADGTMGQVGADGVFRPITTADGTAVRGQAKGGDADQALTAAMAATTQKLLEQVTPETDGGYSPQQIAQAQTAARQIHTPPGQAGGPPPGAVADLRANPKLATAFDEKFGKGASARYLNP